MMVEHGSQQEDRQGTADDEGAGLIDLMGGVDPGLVDLGDDVNRTATNRGSVLPGAASSRPEGQVDPGLVDLGDDVNRTATNRDGLVGDTAGTAGEVDPGLVDLGDDARRGV